MRLLPDVDIPGDLDPSSHCAREGDTWELLGNGRWLPFVIAHGALDESVPITSVLPKVLELTGWAIAIGFTVYPLEGHIGWALEDEFDDPISHMGTGLRQGDLGHIPASTGSASHGTCSMLIGMNPAVAEGGVVIALRRLDRGRPRNVAAPRA